MPHLIQTTPKRPFCVAAKFSSEEKALIMEAAKKLNMRPSAFVRAVVLSSTQTSPIDRLLLAKTCKLEAMLQLLFAGLFSQLNDRIPFEGEHFRQALERAEAVQFGKADEQLARHAWPIKEPDV
jgi:hypothetical protein